MSHLYLAHHGIKGMKWGVRRFRNKDGTLTNAGKQRYDNSNDEQKRQTNKLTEKQKRAIKTGALIAGASLAVLGGVYLYKSMQPNYGFATLSGAPLVDKLDSFGSDRKDISIKAGSKFQRISSEAIEDYKKSGRVYVSYLFGDNLKYRDRMPDVLRVKNPYVHTLKSKSSVKAPSRRVAAEIYSQLNPKSTHAQYINFMTYRIGDSSSESNRFIKRLSELGYNAVIDENDGGSHWTKQPLILLNPEDIVLSGTHRLTAPERVAAVFGR